MYLAFHQSKAMQPIHVAAMLNKKHGLAGKFARKTWRNIIVTSRSCDVTSLFHHLLYDALFTKNEARKASFGSVDRLYGFTKARFFNNAWCILS